MKNCNQCGRCCTLYSDGRLSASAEDIDRWETHRPDIFSHVSRGKIWISPVTGKALVVCPWLEKLPNQDTYLCRIYEDRPEDCRHYPVNIDQMLADNCEMLEPGDLAHPKRAQKILDFLMSDSRPACE